MVGVWMKLLKKQEIKIIVKIVDCKFLLLLLQSILF